MTKIFRDDQIAKHDIDTMKRFLRYKLDGYRVAIKYIIAGNRLYRGVRSNYRPATIDRISYPPPDKVAQLGRLNRVGQSVFYCSRAMPAVFYELRARVGEQIALSEWELTESLWMHNLGFHPDALETIGTPADAGRPQFANPIPNESKKNALMRRNLSLCFIENVVPGQEHRYKQTIAINELHFDRAGPIPKLDGGPNVERAAGTVYPALRMHGSADNLAMWPEFVDSSLRIKSLRYVLIESADEVASSYTFLTIASAHSFERNDIIWADDMPSEGERRSFIFFEGGMWVLRDGLGRVRDWR